MKKYFLNDGASQQGPFDLEELKSKSITAETPVWYEGLPEWTTAGKLEELKEVFIVAPPPFLAPVPPAPLEEIKPVVPVQPEPVVTTTTTTAAVAAATPVVAATGGAVVAGKSTAWVSWLLTILVLGGAGYFVYQDMEKNKGASGSSVQTSGADTSVITQKPGSQASSLPPDATDEGDTAVTTTTDQPVTTTTPTTTTTTTTTTATPQQIAAQKAAAKKLEDDKKKQLAIKKAADDKKKLEAAQAALAARQLEMRTHWSRYITFGNLSYDTKGDGVKAFDVPVYNGTDVMLDKVTVRIEYTKKNDKKIVKTETITIYNIPARGGLNGKAPESKKGDKVNVFITAINSRALNFCYPQNNGNPSDPFFCN